MISADKGFELPVQKSTVGGGTLTKIEASMETEDWGEEISGPLSPKALSVIEEFFGVKPRISSWFMKAGEQIPNSYEFPVRGMARGTDLTLRIWQHGVSRKSQAEIDICAKGGKTLVSGLYCTTQKITWVGIGHNQLLVATEHGILYRAIRQRSRRQDWRGLLWRFSKVTGFWIEMMSLKDHSNGFIRYVPVHLR